MIGDDDESVMTSQTFNVDVMTRHYAITALWASYDDDGDPLDSVYGVDDISPDTYADMRADCAAFAESCAEDLAGMTPEQAGHDFWLTRNGHGTGFWGRGLGERGDRLSAMARPYGDVNLFVGDDGRIWA